MVDTSGFAVDESVTITTYNTHSGCRPFDDFVFCMVRDHSDAMGSVPEVAAGEGKAFEDLFTNIINLEMLYQNRSSSCFPPIRIVQAQ
jgi:hypothetical protein